MENELLLEYRVRDLFASKGWEVRCEVRFERPGKTYFPDIVLYDGGRAVGAVEIKRNHAARPVDFERLTCYARDLYYGLGLSFVMLFIDDEAYVCTKDGFKRIGVLPTPANCRDYACLTEAESDREFERLLVLVRHIDELQRAPRAEAPSGSVFISYKSEERAQAEAVRDFLTVAGYPCWMAPESIPGGQNYLSVITKAIRSCSAVVFMYSALSQASGWCQDELSVARSYGKTVIPYRTTVFEANDAMTFLLSRAQTVGTKDALLNALKCV